MTLRINTLSILFSSLLLTAFTPAQTFASTSPHPIEAKTAQKMGITFHYPPQLVPSLHNIAYTSISPSQTLDLFIPNGKGPFPVVINVHGGGFMLGSKEMLDAPIATALLNHGIAIASINYRLSGEAHFPAAVQDVKAAVRFLRKNAGQYHLNSNNFILFGQSAGGNLVSIAGLTGNSTQFDAKELGNTDISASVKAVIDWFGPTDFLSLDADAKAQGCPLDSQQHAQADSPESRYLGVPSLSNPSLAKQASSLSYVHNFTHNTPPYFLLQKGDKDCMVASHQSQRLYDALKKTNIPVEFNWIHGAGHGDMMSNTPRFLSDKNIQRVISFIDKVVSAK